MTINSFALRQTFKRTNNDPLRRDRRNPHRWVWCDHQARAEAGAFKLEGDWNLDCRAIDPGTAECLSADVADFLGNMHVAVRSGAERAIEFRLAKDLAERDCRYSFEPDKIVIEGGGSAGLWAGLAWMEQEMRLRHGPFLPEGRWERRAQWPVQMSASVWGSNYSVPDLDPEYLGDDSFRLYAHYGVNVMMLHGDLLCYVKSDILPELSHPDYERHIAVLKQAAARALRYGVRLNFHVESPKLKADHPVFKNHAELRGTGFEAAHDGPVHVLCSLHEKTLAFYEETFGRLFREVPDLAGVTLIPFMESFFHCHMCAGSKYPCARCNNVPPEDSDSMIVTTLSGIVNRIARSIKQAQPRAYTAVWIYSFGSGDRMPFVKKFSPEVTILQQLETGAYYKKDGYTKQVKDYSIDYLGPSPTVVQLAELTHQTGREFFVKTETAIGLEVAQFPYVPAMQRLAEKWEIVRSLKPDGVHQAWFFFGMFGSRAEELGFWAAYGKEMSKEDFLRRLIIRDFGAAAVAPIMEAWAHMSQAMGFIPCTYLPTYYRGPGFLGPAHPLVPVKGMAIPELFTEYCPRYDEATFHIGENGTSMVMHTLPDHFGIVVPDNPAEDVWEVVAREYHKAADECRLSLECFCNAGEMMQGEMNHRQLREESLLTELIWRTMMACENTVRFLMARRDYEKSGEIHFLEAMRRVAVIEKENALAAVPIYQEAPWLDVKERTDRRFPHSSLEMIKVKIHWIDEFLGKTRTKTGKEPRLDNESTRIAKWKDDKQGALLLTFDDSLPTQIDNVVPELKKRNLAGTFYVNPGTQRWKERQSSWEKTLPQEFPALGMEYGNHTFTHHGAKDISDFDEEIGKCNDVILKLFPAKQPHLVSYALPGVPKQDWNITDNQENEILVKHHLVRRPEYVIADNSGNYNSVDHLMALADDAIVKGGIKCIVFHGVGGDHHVVDMPIFTEFLDKLAAKRDQFWITAAIPAHKYSIERDGANIKVLQSDDRQIRLQLTSKTDAALYDYPLTLIAKVPATWKQCRVIQGANQFSCQPTGNSIMFDALPNGELITIQEN